MRNESLDWENLETLLNYHEIAPFMYLAVKPYRHLLPDRIDQFLHTHYWSSVTNNLLYEREYRVVHDAFQKEEVGLTPIKGVALMWDLYPRYSIVRPMGDIDVLIREKDYSKACDILEEIGYKKNLEGLTEDYWLNRQCHVVFLKQREVSYPLRLELHLRLDFKRDNKDILPLVWERTRGFEADGKRIQLLSPEDTLFSLALHQRRFGKMFCLKYVLDTSLLLRKYREDFDWDYVFTECKKNALFSCVYFLLCQVKLFADNDILDTAGSPLFPLHKKRKERMARFISKEMNTLNLSQKVKQNYFKAHFLLYDSYWEPIRYIVSIPQEQFAKFYGLQSYSLRSRLFYRFRFAYMIFRLVGEFSTQHKRLKD